MYLPTIAETIRVAEAKWATEPEACLGMLRLALNGATGIERLAALESLVVHSEWAERIKRGLPAYHSVDTSDIGFRFTDVGEYESLFNELNPPRHPMWEMTADDLPPDMGEWARVYLLRAPPDGPLAWLACDGKYFEAFGAVLLKSLKGTAVHVHLMDAHESVIKMIDSCEVECGISIEKPHADRHYYHAVRFIRFAEAIERYKRQLYLLDVDAIANGEVTSLGLGFGARFRPARLEPWNQINAAVVGGSPDSLEYFRNVGRFINKYRKTLPWGVDQLALWRVWKNDPIVGARCYNPKEVDYDYQDDGIIWCNSGAGKFKQLQGDETDRPKYQARFKAIKDTIGAKGYANRGKVALRERRFDDAKRDLRKALDIVAATVQVEPLDAPPENPKNRIGKFLYLPVEVSARELPSRAWLAGQCAKRGFNVVFGASWNMADYKFRDWPPGIVLFKTLNSMDARQFFTAKKAAGHLVAVLSEEMFSLMPDEALYRAEIDDQALLLADLICAQGESSARILRTMTDPRKVVVTGNPRSLFPVKQRGDKIVVCLMSGNVNGFAPFDEYMDMCFRVLGKPPEQTHKLMLEQIEHECKHLPLVLETIDALKAKYGERVIVRPHPVEDKETFGFEADQVPFSTRLGEAGLVVFTSGCGTGVESVLAGVPCVRLGSGGHGLSQQVTGRGMESAQEAINEVEKLLDGGQQVQPLDEHFAPVTLPQALESLWRRNAYPMDFDLKLAHAQRTFTFAPAGFHKNKFPETTDEEVTALAGMPVERLSWNLWLIRSNVSASNNRQKEREAA